jgi:hypothetical protein
MATVYFVIQVQPLMEVPTPLTLMTPTPDKIGDFTPTTGFGNPYPKVGSYFTDNANTVANSAFFNTKLYGQNMFFQAAGAGMAHSASIWSTVPVWTGTERVTNIQPVHESGFDTGLAQEGSTQYLKYVGTY